METCLPQSTVMRFPVIKKTETTLIYKLRKRLSKHRASFFVGKVKVVGKKHLVLLEIDGLGIYKKEVTKIFYSNITLVSYGNRYSEFHNKYSEY